MIIAQYHFTEIFTVFNDELSKSTLAAVAGGITSTGDLLPYVLDILFDSFNDRSLSDVDDQNNDDVGELRDRARSETDTDSGSIFDRFSNVSDDESDSVNPEDELRTVLSMLDDASLLEFVFCKKEKVSVNPST